MKKQMAMVLGAVLVMGSLVAKANEAEVLRDYAHHRGKCGGVKFQALSHGIEIGEIKGKVRDIKDRDVSLDEKDMISLMNKYTENFAQKSELDGQQGIYSFLPAREHSSLRKTGALSRGRDAVGGALVKNFTIWGGLLDDVPTVEKTKEQTQLALPIVFHANTTKAELAQLMCQDLTACQQDVPSQAQGEEVANRISSIQETKNQLGCN